MSTLRTRQTATRQRIGRVVRNRFDSASQELWSGYIGHALSLPKLLQQHGLRLALEYLQFLAKHRKDAAAQALLSDWGSAPQMPDPAAPSLASMLAAQAAATSAARVSMVLQAERQALLEAEAFKRYGELLTVHPPERGAVAPSAQAAATLVLPNWWPPTPPAAAVKGHLALSLRYGGSVPARAALNDEVAKTFRSDKVKSLVDAGAELLKAWAEPGGHSGQAVLAQALRRREADLRSIGHHCFNGELAQRLYTAHGERGVWETFVDLHPTLGVPVVRGSAIKSCLKRDLTARLSHLDDAQLPVARAWIAALLGSDDDPNSPQGVLQFHDAWWRPGGACPGPLVADVDTPHHAAYYQGRQPEARATDSPEPQPQWAVRGRFLLAVGLAPSLMRTDAPPCPTALIKALDAKATTPEDNGEGGWEWLLQLAIRWLQRALVMEGLGAAKRISAGRFHPNFQPAG